MWKKRQRLGRVASREESLWNKLREHKNCTVLSNKINVQPNKQTNKASLCNSDTTQPNNSTYLKDDPIIQQQSDQYKTDTKLEAAQLKQKSVE